MLSVQTYSEEQTYKMGKWVGRNVNPGDIILYLVIWEAAKLYFPGV